MLWFLGDFFKLKLPDDALKESRPRGNRKFTVGAQGLRPCPRLAPLSWIKLFSPNHLNPFCYSGKRKI